MKKSTDQLAFARKSLLILTMVLLLSCKDDPVSHLKVGRDVVLHHQSSDINLYHEVPHRASDSMINVLIEIPAGSFYKYEYDKENARMDIELINGTERQIDYLPYPAHYGMIPRTLSPKELGGDGDPLDVILIGPPIERGEIMPARLVGVLRLLDTGEEDDKLIAISPEWADGVRSLAALQTDYPRLTEILTLWWTNYKGDGVMEYIGLEDEHAAAGILLSAHKAYLNEEAAR